MGYNFYFDIYSFDAFYILHQIITKITLNVLSFKLSFIQFSHYGNTVFSNVLFIIMNNQTIP